MRDTFGVNTIVKDMRQMAGKVGDVHFTGKKQCISSAVVWAGGFSCTFLLKLNSKATDAERCLNDRYFVTGDSCFMVTDYFAEWLSLICHFGECCHGLWTI